MANVPLSFKKLASVAGIGNTPDTMYLVQAPDSEIVDIYVSDSTGTNVRRIANEAHILQNYITIADVAPALPCKTQLWWSSASGALCIQFEVVEGIWSWVEIVPSFSIPDFAGTGTANTMARSDHYHFSLRLTEDVADWGAQ